MTRNQQIAALRAILIYQNTIRASLGQNPPPELSRRASRDLEALDGAFDAIYAIKTEG